MEKIITNYCTHLFIILVIVFLSLVAFLGKRAISADRYFEAKNKEISKGI